MDSVMCNDFWTGSCCRIKVSGGGAARLLNNVITIIREPFTLEVIHGYNRGTVLRTYVNTELKNKRIKDRYICRYNEGVTVLNIA